MKTQKFTNGNELTLIENKNLLYKFMFELKFADGETDKVGYNEGSVKSWLQDNCDIEGTTENEKLFFDLIN